MNVTLDHIDQINYHIKTFWFKPPQPVDYIAGQYIEMKLPHTPADDRGIKRWFTISSSPSESLISITTKFSEPSSSFKANLAKLSAAAQVHISDPMGDFVLPKDKNRPIVFVVAGIGVTPARSMIKWLTDTDEKRDIQIIYGASSETDLVFRELLGSYSEKITYVISNSSAGQKNAKKLSAGFVLDTITNLDEKPLIYISGPESLVEGLTKGLSEKIDENNLVSDYFPGYIQL